MLDARTVSAKEHFNSVRVFLMGSLGPITSLVTCHSHSLGLGYSVTAT